MSDAREFKKLWVDDVRPEPSIWDRAFTFHEAVFKLDLLEYEEISLDHDLNSFYGLKEMTGYDIVQWLVYRKNDGLYVPKIIHVHSANVPGKNNMESLINRYLK